MKSDQLTAAAHLGESCQRGASSAVAHASAEGSVAASTIVRRPTVHHALFVKELDRRIHDIRLQLEKIKELPSNIAAKISPVLARLSEYSHSDEQNEESAARELQVSTIVLREIEGSLKRCDSELALLHANYLQSAEGLQRKIEEGRTALLALEMRQKQMEAAVVVSAERKKNECWVVAVVMDFFRSAGPTVEEVREGERNVERSSRQIVHYEEQMIQVSGDICSLFDRRDAVSQFMGLIGRIRAVVEGRLDAVVAKNKFAEKAAAASRCSEAPAAEKKMYRFRVKIPPEFFTQLETALAPLKLPAEQQKRVNDWIRVIKQHNAEGFSSNDEVVARLNVLLGDMREMLGTESEPVQFFLHAFSEMLEDVI